MHNKLRQLQRYPEHNPIQKIDHSECQREQDPWDSVHCDSHGSPLLGSKCCCQLLMWLRWWRRRWQWSWQIFPDAIVPITYDFLEIRLQWTDLFCIIVKISWWRRFYIWTSIMTGFSFLNRIIQIMFVNLYFFSRIQSLFTVLLRVILVVNVVERPVMKWFCGRRLDVDCIATR